MRHSRTPKVWQACSFLAAALVTLLLSTATSAQAPARSVRGFYPELTGEWAQTLDLAAPAEYQLSSAQAQTFARRLGQLASILREARVFNPPLGFQPRLRERFWFPGRCLAAADRCSGMPVQAQIGMTFYYFIEEGGKPNWGGEANTSADIWVNDLLATLGRNYDLGYEGLPLPDGRRISYLPRKSGEIAGFPVYEDRTLVVTNGRRPVWVPVTRDQYLLATIQWREQELARTQSRPGSSDQYRQWESQREERRKTREQMYRKLKATDPAAAEKMLRQSLDMEARMEAALKSSATNADPGLASLKPLRDTLDALRAQRAALSPAERAEQACLAGRVDQPATALDLERRLVPATTEGARPLVAINPDFFDRTRPRADWQLITVTVNTGGLPRDHIGVKRLFEFRESVDWKRVAALLDAAGPAQTLTNPSPRVQR